MRFGLWEDFWVWCFFALESVWWSVCWSLKMWSLLFPPDFAFCADTICFADEGRRADDDSPVLQRIKARDQSSRALLIVHNHEILCSFYFSGSQTRSTYIHLLCTASSGFNSNGFHVRFPHFIRSSMWMTYIISEISTFFTNCAFSHDSTSLTLFFNRFYSTRWSQVLQVKK